MRYPGKTVIGGFNASYNKRCLFIYKAHTKCNGYIIRKAKWVSFETEHPHMYNYLKRKTLFNYLDKIRKPLLEQKDHDIEHFDLRADF